MGGMDQFLPNAICLGDLLSQQGYHLEYFGGSSLDFAGKGNFYKSHSFNNVFGLHELLPQIPDPTYTTGWGIYDDTLFDLAYDRFKELSEKDSPFGMVLLTIDTHGSGNHISRTCKEDFTDSGKNGFIEALSCTDRLVGGFIDRLKNSPYFDDAVVVISSDHLKMGRVKEQRDNPRRNLFIIINSSQPQNSKIVAKNGSILDMGVTVLNAMGFDSQLGLGRNLLGKETTIKEKLQLNDQILNGWREDMKFFMSFPRVSDHITVDSKNRSVFIDDREFKLPILIKYDSKLNTNMWFEKDGDIPVHKSLIGHLKEFAYDSPFFLADECGDIKRVWPDLSTKGFCYVNGKLGSSNIIMGEIKGVKRFSSEQI
jgi:phosphoglycerol transferase